MPLGYALGRSEGTPVDAWPFVFFIPFFFLAVAAFVVWIWALVDAVKVPDDSMFRAGNKLIWVLIIVLAQVIGAIIYLVVGRPTAADRLRAPADPNRPPPPPPGALP
jgi:hypothetical protein